MAIVIDRSRIDELLNKLVIMTLKAQDAGTIMEAQRVIGNQFADLIYNTADNSNVVEEIQECIEELKRKSRGTESNISREKFRSKADGMEAALYILSNNS